MEKRILAVLLAISVFLGSSLFDNTSVLATDGGSSALELVLNQSKSAADQKIAEIQNAGMKVPDSANSTYSQGLAEYQTALSLTNTDFQESKIHALKAMNLFTNTIRMVENQGNGTSEINQTSTLVQSIEYSQNSEAQIRGLAEVNGIPDSIFKGYEDAINAANTAIASGNFQSAKQQIFIAQGLLDKIYQQLQDQAQSAVDSRASTFRNTSENVLLQMIENAKSSGLDQSTINALQTELDRLEASKTTSQIIETTNQSSQLQNVTDQYNNQILVNFDKESLNMEHKINVLQGLAAQHNLQFTGLTLLSQMLVDIKQKMINGQTDDAASELDQEYSLLSGMNDVVNGAASVVQEINTDRNTSQILQSKAQAENDSVSMGDIGQANQLLDSAYSTVINATSADDLKSAMDSLSNAEDILNGISDTLNGSNQQSSNLTQSSNSTNSTSNSQPQSSDNMTNATESTNNSTNSTDQSNSTSSTNDNSTS
ncbi:MAG: hypothetical protein KGH83_00745 [Thaumarchaeota archaeon]|nr:hypothetical protein [Nitrososphaerota archaeon]